MKEKPKREELEKFIEAYLSGDPIKDFFDEYEIHDMLAYLANFYLEYMDGAR